MQASSGKAQHKKTPFSYLIISLNTDFNANDTLSNPTLTLSYASLYHTLLAPLAPSRTPSYAPYHAPSNPTLTLSYASFYHTLPAPLAPSRTPSWGKSKYSDGRIYYITWLLFVRITTTTTTTTSSLSSSSSASTTTTATTSSPWSSSSSSTTSYHPSLSAPPHIGYYRCCWFGILYTNPYDHRPQRLSSLHTPPSIGYYCCRWLDILCYASRFASQSVSLSVVYHWSIISQ